ncbi:antitoxin Xre/MbcA/ParS toxin-binding domain-containing protein [Niabella hirudinis]|uniref:antitoxin Xre/MbcA/ParS toxin-binding domain-containing protein n=1 Tax=Niabella hirudinis TaxID=1285929 RepID=UPI003EB7B1D4
MIQGALNSKTSRGIIDAIPPVSDYMQVYHYTNSHDIGKQYLQLLDELVQVNDETVAGWLNVNPRTYRNYKQQDQELKGNIKEHIVLLLALYKRGIELFGSAVGFKTWLTAKNHLLDGKMPAQFLDAFSGIQFINSRLTAMEYGENV